MRMSLRKNLCRILLCLFALHGARAFAWNNVGHMAVAYLAWRDLTPAQRTRTTVLVKLNPLYPQWAAQVPASVTRSQRDMYMFMMAATWADQIKSDATDFPCNAAGNTNVPPAGEDVALNVGYADSCMHKYWHFLDLRYAPDGSTPVPVAVPTPNAQVKIDFLERAIKAAEPDALKSYDLVWLEHLVGDIHQPLHTVARFSADHPTGDAGGNDVKITGPQKELHAYWDDILGESACYPISKPNCLYTDALLAKKIGQGTRTPKRTVVRDLKTADWIAESEADAETAAYMSPPIGPSWGPYTTNAVYHEHALAVSEDRITLAGARLAGVIGANLR